MLMQSMYLMYLDCLGSHKMQWNQTLLWCSRRILSDDKHWFQVGAAGITSTWAGGERGRVVIDRMLTKVDNLMSSKGWFYMVTLTANNPSEICQIMKKKGFASRIVIQVLYSYWHFRNSVWRLKSNVDILLAVCSNYFQTELITPLAIQGDANAIVVIEPHWWESVGSDGSLSLPWSGKVILWYCVATVKVHDWTLNWVQPWLWVM